MLEYLVFAAAFASILGAALYIRSMFRGNAKPNRVTWLMWSIAPFIATAAAASSGVTWAAIPVFMTGFAPFLIFVASFFTKKAYWKLTTFDYLCGALSAVALILWFVTMEPNLAISLAIASDALAAIPTLGEGLAYPRIRIRLAIHNRLIQCSHKFCSGDHVYFPRDRFSRVSNNNQCFACLGSVP